MKLNFGICMDGCEEAMERHLRRAVANVPNPTYLEIGVAQGTTLTAMAFILRDCSSDWTAVGIDLPDGYSLVRNDVISSAAERKFTLNLPENIPAPCRPQKNQVTLYLKNSQAFLRENWNQPIHFAFIDGCHGKPCVKADFELVDKFIPVGGIVVFHDFGQDSVGEPQPHCGLGDTIGACHELGLMDGTRPGWKYVETVVGDKTSTSSQSFWTGNPT
jgi:hypothetical protein